jgi:hypothetical protein
VLEEIVKGAELVIGEASALAIGEEGDGDPPAAPDGGSIEAPAGAPEAVAVSPGDEAAGLQPIVTATSASVSTRNPAAMPGSLDPRAQGGNHGRSPTQDGALMHQFNTT